MRTENPVPRANAESRAYSKIEQGQDNRGSADGCKACGSRARHRRSGGLRDSLRKSGPIDFAEINRTALAAFPAVLARILPGSKRVGAER